MEELDIVETKRLTKAISQTERDTHIKKKQQQENGKNKK